MIHIHSNPTNPPPGKFYRYLQSLIRMMIYGSVFISLCTVALCIETSYQLDIPLNSFPFYLVVFCATLGQYNIHYFIKRTANPDSDRFWWSAGHRGVHFIFNLIGAVGLITGLLHLGIKHLLALGFIMAITVLYSFPLLPFPHKKRLKDFGLLKIAVLSFVWTLITVWFPVVNLGRITPAFMVVFAGRFVFMFALCLAFDIRDKSSDETEAIRTLPVVLGIKSCYQIILLALVGFVALAIWEFRISLQFMQLNALIISALATYFMIEYSRKNASDMVYLAGIDGMMLLQALLVIAATLA